MWQHVWHHIVQGVCDFEFIECGHLVQVQLLTVEFAVDLGYIVCEVKLTIPCSCAAGQLHSLD